MSRRDGGSGESLESVLEDSRIFIEWDLPGQGNSWPYCGTYHEGHACPDHFEESVKVYLQGCGRRDCPKCMLRWAAKRGSAVGERLYGIQFEARRRHLKWGRPYHAVFSPEPEDPEALRAFLPERPWTVDDFRNLRTECIANMKRAGCHGGVVIFHGWRNTKADKSGEWYWSPHFHVFGFGWLMPSPEFHDLTGWVYKKIRTLTGLKDISRAASYLFDHCALGTFEDGKERPGTFQCGVWFGTVSNCKVEVVEAPPEESYLECPVEDCDKPMMKFECEDQELRPEDSALPGWGKVLEKKITYTGLAVVRPRRREYRLRGMAPIGEDPPPGEYVPVDAMAERDRISGLDQSTFYRLQMPVDTYWKKKLDVSA